MAGSRSAVEEVLEAGRIPGRTLVAEPGGGDHPLAALHRQGEAGGAVLGRDRTPSPRTAPGAGRPAGRDGRRSRPAHRPPRRRSSPAPAATGRAASRAPRRPPRPRARAPRRRGRRLGRPPTVRRPAAGPSPWSRARTCTPGSARTAPWSPPPSAAWSPTRPPSPAAGGQPAVLAQPGHGAGVERHGVTGQQLAPEPGQQALDGDHAPVQQDVGLPSPGARRGGAAARPAADPAPAPCTVQPRLARAAAASSPAMLAPITTAVRSAAPRRRPRRRRCVGPSADTGPDDYAPGPMSVHLVGGGRDLERPRSSTARSWRRRRSGRRRRDEPYPGSLW